MFSLLGMRIKISKSAVVGTVLLLAIFTWLATTALELQLIGALLWGVAATLLYWSGEIFHQYGHFIAARRTGYPMTGVRLWAVLGMSLYPDDEPELPPAVHIRRALGGAPVSIALGIVFGMMALLLKDSLPLPLWGLLALFASVNLLFFGLGSFIPLSFTDGGTVLYYRGKS